LATDLEERWQPVEPTRASAEVVRQITAAFFQGMSPGERLGTERELAERFGISRITVRDAVRELEARGIVEVKIGARGGLRVASGDPRRFAEALAVQLHLMAIEWAEVREAQRAIEPVTASLAARRATSDECARLRALIGEARAAREDPAAFTDLALEFHLAIADASRNRVLRAALGALREVQRRELEPSSSDENTRRVLAEHEAILRAISAGEEAEAARSMTAHLDFVLAERA